MKNKLAYLGFLGFFSFLGPFTFLGENITAAWCMVGFFYFFLYAKVIPDELFILHIQKSAARAFFVGLMVMVPTLITLLVIENVAFIRLYFTLSFSITLLTFIINLEIFERREKKGIQDRVQN